MVDTCNETTQSFSYVPDNSDSLTDSEGFPLQHRHYDECYKTVFGEIATILETTATYMTDLAASVDQIKSDVNALKIRAESPNLGVVMTGGWFTDCDGGDGLQNALVVSALKEAEMYDEYINEVNNPTTL